MTATSTLPSTPPAPTAETGLFESHVTLRCAEEQLPSLASWCAAAGLKLTHILLARGAQPSQPMLTLSGEGSLPEQRAAAYRLADRLREAGFEPVRVKIEAAPWAPWIPQSAAEAAQQDPTRHFEHHLKLLLPADHDLGRLAELVSPHGAHVSWNARRIFDAGLRHERFVTQRCHGLGLPQASARLNSLVSALREHGHELLSIEQEYVVHDSNAAVDDGWITTEVQA